ncbi:MAG TPA: hypothetical protein VF649_02545 [Sphingomonas sp.]|jgi:hypothetical protein|uniref:hypothetical protein n=1 Tax=Sphingomonas sp. TaxID=28214 RepID=UPI002ED78CE1
MSPRARSWTVLLLPPAAWFLFEQGLSHVLHRRCGLIGIGLAWGVASLAMCAAAGRGAWSLTRKDGAPADRWLAQLALAVAGIFALAISFQTLAIMMVPPCVR